MRDESVPGIPLPAEAGPRKWDWRLAVSMLNGLIPILIALVLIVPEFEKVYRQIKVQMPDSTEALLLLSNATCRYLWLIGFVTVLFTWDIGQWTGWQARVARSMIPLITFLTAIWMTWALFSPLLSVHPGIGQKKH